jgi:hypothetical protein
VAGDNDTAGTSSLALLDEVDLVEALPLIGSLELLSKLVVTNTAGIHDRVRGKHILSSNTFSMRQIIPIIRRNSQQPHGRRFGQHRQQRT